MAVGLRRLLDLVAPSGSTSVASARLRPRSSIPAVAAYRGDRLLLRYYVQLPASGGGYQDLIVGSYNIPRSEVIGLIQQVVAKYETSAPGELGPCTSNWCRTVPPSRRSGTLLLGPTIDARRASATSRSIPVTLQQPLRSAIVGIGAWSSATA